MARMERAQNAIHSTLPPLPASPTVSDEGVPEPSYLVPSAPPAEDKSPPISNVLSKPIPKGGSKPKLTAKEKKARDVRKIPALSSFSHLHSRHHDHDPLLPWLQMWIERLLDLAPVDFRGRDATLRNAVEGVILGLMEATTGLRPADLVRMPTLTPVLVNKCLMALVGAKVVNKVTSKGVAVYSLSDLAWKSQRNDAR
ncbi:hypothetical protein BS47DRAFT_1353501 [Hydnum rufescens UP504]|uniref:Uncharacterized protein n=1 Tax=Hydnum rufescens UP504 TaxID=1448309 RepID=A0A9P6AHQ1_9AGAM|nr:hypothetical protein BS47DRAFT_1353501 [Hydnum rufescens UP504]